VKFYSFSSIFCPIHLKREREAYRTRKEEGEREEREEDLGGHGGACPLVFELKHLASHATTYPSFLLQVIHTTQLVLLGREDIRIMFGL
jgi:hypothetical protein